MSLADELERLHRLHEAGALTDEEFAAAKARLLAQHDGGPQKPSDLGGWRWRDRLQDGRFWAMLLHLSLLLNISLPGLGLVVPFLIWQLGRGRFPELDVHGKNVANFVLSYLIYAGLVGIIGLVMSLVPLVGASVKLLWIALGSIVVLLIFWTAWQAHQGRTCKYPLTFPFFV